MNGRPAPAGCVPLAVWCCSSAAPRGGRPGTRGFARLAALESATEQPLAFTIGHSANPLDEQAGQQYKAPFAAARLQAPLS